jgi:translocon-associated protein subunit beta
MARRATLVALLAGALLLLSPLASVRAEDEGVADDDEYADVQRALLVVYKFTKDELVIQGKNVTIEVDIYNSGAA